MKQLIKSLFFFGATIASFVTSLHSMDQDEIISQKVINVYKSINENWHYPINQETPVDTTDSWKLLDVFTDRGTISMVAWDFEKQPSFSNALEEITNSQLTMECSNAARIARLALISCVVGDEGMLDLISALRKQHPSSNYNLMSALSWHFFERTKDDAEPKFYAYPFINIPEYQAYKNGPDANHNIIKLPNGLYIGFEPEFFSKEHTYEELSQYMFERFKDPSNVEKGMNRKHKKFANKLGYEAFKKKREEYQHQIGYFAFNPPRA